MRKLLLASAAIMGATGGLALAQTTPNPSQGQLIGPYGAGPAANNNNNVWGIANTPTGSVAAGPLSTIYAPNVIAVPVPGTIVIRLNGRVEIDTTAVFTSADTSQSVNAEGVAKYSGYKLNPIGIGAYMRLYPGFDGVSSNGLRYGASIELRQNYGAADRPFAATGATGGTALSPSSGSSTQTVFVRRAFGYVASDQVGLLRLGTTDGVIGLFDNCIFTSQCWDGGQGNFNGGGIEVGAPTNPTAIPFVWLAQAGADYDNAKIVYLSPQLYGFDVGAQYAPSMGNIYTDGSLGVGCAQAGPTCINVSSGNDPTRWLNQVGIGARYQHNFGAADLKLYGFYEAAGKETLTTTGYSTVAAARAGAAGGTALYKNGAAGVVASAQTLPYDNLSFYKAGAALTAFNTTIAADYIGGAVNGQLAMRPTGGAPTNAVVTGITYANGPLTAGIEVGLVYTQGDARLTGITQRREEEFAFGGAYKVAPGFQIAAEYNYTYRYQGGFNFNAGALGTTQSAKGQGVVFATVFTW